MIDGMLGDREKNAAVLVAPRGLLMIAYRIVHVGRDSGSGELRAGLFTVGEDGDGEMCNIVLTCAGDESASVGAECIGISRDDLTPSRVAGVETAKTAAEQGGLQLIETRVSSSVHRNVVLTVPSVLPE
jgi:hypothetical protein